MMHLGTGFDLWARNVDKTLTTDKLNTFLTVADEAKKDLLLIQRYFLSSWDPVPWLDLCQMMDPAEPSLQSDDYP